MAVRVAINGFGRTGRLVLRAIVESGRKDIEVATVNDLGSVEANARLLNFDLTHWPSSRSPRGSSETPSSSARGKFPSRRSRTLPNFPTKN